MNKNKKFYRNAAIFLLLITITFYLLLKDINLKDFINIIISLKFEFVLIGIGLAFIYLICESVAFKIIFKQLKETIAFRHLIRYSFIGFYFSSITPSASGGQPMQIYYMKKDGISVSKSSLAVLLCVLGYQTSLILFFLLSFIFQFQFLQENLSKIKILLIISISVNIVLWLFIVGMIFSKHLLPNILKSIIQFLHKIKIIKNLEYRLHQIETTMDEYHRCADLFKTNKFLFVKILCVYMFQLFIRFSISYFAAKALSLQHGQFIDFITIQSIILFCVSSIPLPGGVGLSETLYITLFTKLVPVVLLNVAALVTQLMNYYSMVFIACIVVLYSHFKYNK